VKKVLIIDDDEMHLVLVRQILDSEECSVLSTADGPHGITLFKDHRPDLVLLDLGLPSMNGIDVLKEIRKIDRGAKVIVVTGYASAETAHIAERHGAMEVVQKPVDLMTFLEKIRRVLNLPGAQDP
jgi:DNA-binding NtrC family response regulator